MENVSVEYKRELSDGLEKEVVSFLNTLGGEIVIGVDNDGNIVGVSDPDETCLKIADRLKNNIAPSIMGLFQISIVGNALKYIKISIASGVEKPYFIKKYGMSSKGCYVRIGTQSAPMEQAQIENVFSRRISRTLSTTVSQRQDLTFRQLRIFYEEHGFDTSGDYFLKNLGMFTEDGKFNYFARMLSDQSDVSIKLARFRGTDKVEIITNKEFGYCCILKSVYNILDALDNYNLPSVEITYPRRIEKFLINKTALREAAINAIVHNDYVRGCFPLFEIYDDRINIVSSGGLVPELTREEFFNGCSMPRNRELMRVFRDMELVENFGSGMRRIMQVYGENVFKISEHFIQTEFYYDKDVLEKIQAAVVTDSQNEPINDGNVGVNDEDVGVNVGVNGEDVGVNDEDVGVNVGVNGEDVGVKLSLTARKVLEYLHSDNSADANKMAEVFAVTRRTVERALKKLRDSGYIRRVGSDKAGYYEILKSDRKS